MRNLRKGLFRLWIISSVCWIGGAGWFLREELRLLDSEAGRAGSAINALSTLESRDQLFNEVQLEALEWIVFPSIAAFVLGLAFVWVIRGFQGQKPN